MDFSNIKILVLGDLILDKYVYGKVERISPEACIPILEKSYQAYRLGGASNVAINLIGLGVQTWICGRIGTDLEGKYIKNLISKSQINVDLLIKDQNIPTTLKTRFVCNNQQLLRVDKEKKERLTIKQFNTLLEDLERHIQYFDAIIISDYDKGFITEELLLTISDLCVKYNKLLIGDSKKSDLSLFKDFTCLTPNKEETKKLFPNCYNNDQFKSFMKLYDIKMLLRTLSEDGLSILTETNYVKIKATKQNIVDISGCGDTVIAVFTAFLAKGYKPEIAASFANQAAGIVASKPSTASIKLEELKCT